MWHLVMANGINGPSADMSSILIADDINQEVIAGYYCSETSTFHRPTGEQVSAVAWMPMPTFNFAAYNKLSS